MLDIVNRLAGVGLGGIHKDHTRDVVGIQFREDSDARSAPGLSDQNVRWREAGVLQRRVELVGDMLGMAWQRTRLGFTRPRAIVRDNTREAADGAADSIPPNTACGPARF